jgi:GNAT superfamily N-acetyltransferase
MRTSGAREVFIAANPHRRADSAPTTCSATEPMSEAFVVREATVDDRRFIAHHRAAMFVDMGSLDAASAGALRDAAERWLETAMPRGEYVGWLVVTTSDSSRVVAGAGVQVRRVLPFPQRDAEGGSTIAEGRQAIVVNVYTEPEFRRRGLARALMQAVLAWARSVKLESLVLHAAPDGEPLYRALGFVPTNEMRFKGRLTD